jgi:hypothetical protein
MSVVGCPAPSDLPTRERGVLAAAGWLYESRARSWDFDFTE